MRAPRTLGSMPQLPYRDPSPSPVLTKLMGHLNRHIVLPRILRVSRVELPDADRQRLTASVNPSTSAFLTPSHPEFLTDWMIDKEISRRFAPDLVSWAASDIVNASPLAQRFWLANGLIANTPGGGGKAYSLQQARLGRGVLLHPEGAVNWQAERVWPLHPGAMDMAVSLVQSLDAVGDPRPVLVVPMGWRLTFTRNVSEELLREMELIEHECGLSLGTSDNPAERLTTLLCAILTQRAQQLGLRRPDLSSAHADPRYFEAQALIINEIRGRLTSTYGPMPEDPVQALRAVQRGIRRRGNLDPIRAAQDHGLMLELLRLSRLNAALYGRDTITQEQVAEILKATRALVVTEGFRNRLHNFLPRAVAPRVAHVRVADAFDVRQAVADGGTTASLTTSLHRSLQGLQDTLSNDLELWVGAFRMANPMACDLRNGYLQEPPNLLWNNRAS